MSDYDPSKPSLWEDQRNKDKTIALWRKLAERYSAEPWIGGYDLINETNWTFSNGNVPLKELFVNITNAIREVDTNHIIIIEGNGFANDFSGLTPKWDDNMVYSFHKYWSYNDAGSIDWMLTLRNQQNCPIWLGESGENSNSWFASLISLCEKNRVGWSWWPVKKPGINNPLKVDVNSDYSNLIKYWSGTGPALTADQAFSAVLQFAENHKLENCSFQKDVVDAMIRQPHTDTIKPFRVFNTGEPIFATDYNMGRCGIAYFETDSANYNSSTGTYTTWNQGWSYRNDAVDIEACTDSDLNNGFGVGWTSNNEWMEYTVDCDTTAAFTLRLRSASGSSGCKFHLEEKGLPLTGKLTVAGTGGWQSWKTTSLGPVILTKGRHNIRFFFDQGGSNLNYFMFSDPVAVDSIAFTALYARTSTDGKQVIITLNKEITSSENQSLLTDLTVKLNNAEVLADTVYIDSSNPFSLILVMSDPVYYGAKVTVSYTGAGSVQSNEQSLDIFSSMEVVNKLPVRYNLPGRIQAENCAVNSGFNWETCEDTGGGQNTSYANTGDYLDFYVYVPTERSYQIGYRVATIRTNGEIMVQINAGGSFISVDTLKFKSTGGWQTWNTQTSKLNLPAGRYTLRLKVKGGEFNLNWFELSNAVGIQETGRVEQLLIYPNPASGYFYIESEAFSQGKTELALMDITGRIVYKAIENGPAPVKVDCRELPPGLYLVVIKQQGVIIQSGRIRIAE
ncbi:MAG: carbohydrate-binding protein [Bacteroidales bacterium]